MTRLKQLPAGVISAAFPPFPWMYKTVFIYMFPRFSGRCVSFAAAGLCGFRLSASLLHFVPQQPYRAAPTIPNAFLFFLHPAKTSQSHFLDLQALSGGINRILFLLSALLVREKLNLCLQEFSADEQQSDYLML